MDFIEKIFINDNIYYLQGVQNEENNGSIIGYE